MVYIGLPNIFMEGDVQAIMVAINKDRTPFMNIELLFMTSSIEGINSPFWFFIPTIEVCNESAKLKIESKVWLENIVRSCLNEKFCFIYLTNKRKTLFHFYY